MRRTSGLIALLFSVQVLYSQAWAAEGKDYHDQDLKEKDFNGATLNGADFSDAILDHANFSFASLKKASFKDAHFNFTNFYKADLTEADFTGVKGPTRFSEANLSKAKLAGVEFMLDINCSFRGADLRKCKITNGVSNADFSGADIRGANFRGARIDPAARWKGAIYDDDTAWPDGFDPKAAGAVMGTEEKKEVAPKAADEKKDK